MDDKSNPGLSPDTLQARKALGLAEETFESDEDASGEAEAEEESKGADETETETEEAEAEDESDESDESEGEAAEEKEAGESKSAKAPAKERSPLRAAFSQINELRDIVKDLAVSVKSMNEARGPKEIKEAKEEAKATVDGMIAELESANAKLPAEQRTNTKWLRDFAKTIMEESKGSVEKELQALKETLQKSSETTQKLAEKDALAERTRLESKAFSDEWNEYLPELKKAYPNASDELLADARNLMRGLATSEAYGGESIDGTKNKGKQPMPLDYIAYKEKAKLDTLLNVKSGKSGQRSSTVKEIERDESDDPYGVDLDPENMTPDKFKEFQRRKVKHYEPPAIEVIS